MLRGANEEDLRVLACALSFLPLALSEATSFLSGGKGLKDFVDVLQTRPHAALPRLFGALAPGFQRLRDNARTLLALLAFLTDAQPETAPRGFVRVSKDEARKLLPGAARTTLSRSWSTRRSCSARTVSG